MSSDDADHFLVLASSILDRERAKLRAKAVIDRASPNLKEIVDYGCGVYAQCLHDNGHQYIHKPALALYYHVLEMTDAIQILVENSSVEPVAPLMRSALEAVFSLEYLFQKDYEHRSLVWRYHYLRKNLRQYDPEEQDEEVQKYLKEQGNEMSLDAITELRKIRNRLESDEFEDIHQKLKGKQVPNHWYSWVMDEIKKGPGSFKELAKNLDEKPVFPDFPRMHLPLYHVVYTTYSRKVHGDSYPYTKELRWARHMGHCVIRAAGLMRHAIGLMIVKFIPDRLEGFKAWYQGIGQPSSQSWDL